MDTTTDTRTTTATTATTAVPTGTTAAGTLRLPADEIGPAGLSNGGFACGTFAGLVGGTARVTLREGIPVATDLTASVDGGVGSVTLDGALLATATEVAPFVLEPPVRPTFAEAEAARTAHPFRDVKHPLTDCVVCGPDREDGLRVTPGPLAAAPDVLASPFVPPRRFAPDGQVRAAAVWGALDCPSFPAASMRARRFSLLGSLEAHQVRPVRAEERLVVVGWTTGVGNRSTRTASAMIGEDGSVVASARAIWVALGP